MRKIKTIQKKEVSYLVEFESGDNFDFSLVFDEGEWALNGCGSARYSQSELTAILKEITELNKKTQ